MRAMLILWLIAGCTSPGKGDEPVPCGVVIAIWAKVDCPPAGAIRKDFP